MGVSAGQQGGLGGSRSRREWSASGDWAGGLSVRIHDEWCDERRSLVHPRDDAAPDSGRGAPRVAYSRSESGLQRGAWHLERRYA